MTSETIYIGDNEFHSSKNSVAGGIVKIDGRDCYKISNYDLLQPFFMNIVSSNDLWMFISSNGALTAGRRNSDHSLFPYYTEDRIHDSHGISGPITILITKINSKKYIWQPFSAEYKGIYNTSNNIYKSILGNYILFEEINHDLGLSFSYSWSSCDKFGFVRRSDLKDLKGQNLEIDMIDGVQNLLPAQLNPRLQLEYSNLVDAYKKAEYLNNKNIAAYSLSSIPTDRAEPSEALKANIAWTHGLNESKILLSNSQLKNFKLGHIIQPENIIRGKRTAFLVNSKIYLAPNDKHSWYLICDANKDQSDLVSLSNAISNTNNIGSLLENEIAKGDKELQKKIARNDGVQLVNDKLSNFRHTSNVLFNIMRGGIFDHNYQLDRDDFYEFVKNANKNVFKKINSKINDLPKQISFEVLLKISENDRALQRLIYEYLPLTFSRRHGDPSRPWNRFSIDIKDENGEPRLDYQGNWRDIFQNWEALALSFPAYLNNMIVKFLNASTADGYNPYRVTRDGFDWEVIEPDDEWSYIGYWGDHQIIYLLKLLELLSKYDPKGLNILFEKDFFTFANVPYRIRSYKDLLQDPQETVDFDFELDEEINERVAEIGFDGKFLADDKGDIISASFAEKLLVPLLVKLSNFVPDAGIWMNTQRPEWNDANNALVGYGASMVTVYYMRRYVVFLTEILKKSDIDSFKVHREVHDFFSALKQSFTSRKTVNDWTISNQERKEFLDQIGEIGSVYRLRVYNHGLADQISSLQKNDLIEFLENVQKALDSSIRSNKRNDDFYHAYNLLSITNTEIGVRRLYEMLEGQVAVLSSGLLTLDESLKVLRSLRKSSLYREDQKSYILYPNRELPGFLEKNSIKQNRVAADSVLRDLLDRSDISILKNDEIGNWHFHSKYRNANILRAELESLKNEGLISDTEMNSVNKLYEEEFDHQSFTGRSGTFFKFEGLGSIYWHMVSKLLLAVQEIYLRSSRIDENDNLEELKDIYYEIKEGLGLHKNPANYGSFPTDAYSHTPENEGAQQPGMTGQVKEDIISRFGELGVIVESGKIHFVPTLLNEEFLTQSDTFTYYNVLDQELHLQLEEDQLAFTICQVPVIYKRSKNKKITVYKNEMTEEIHCLELSQDISRSIFHRDNSIIKIEVEII